MAQVKHTSGPLKAHDQRDDAISHRYSIMSKDGVVALITLSDGTFADLTLWAAAPDLLAAAECFHALELPDEECHRVLVRHGYDGEVTEMRFVRALRQAAMAKATGGQ